MRTILPMLAVLSACAGDEAPPGVDSGDAADDSGALPDCQDPSEIGVDEPVSAGDLTSVGLEGLRGTDGYTLEWSTTVGTLDPTDAIAPTWDLDGVATHSDEVAELTVVLTHDDPACETITRTAQVTVQTWTDAARVVVVYNPEVDGSLDVAEAYQALHDLDDGQLCPVSSTEATTITDDDLTTYIEDVMSCVDTVGDHAWTIVSVYGTPYRVSGAIADIGDGGSTTVSIDALLFYGRRAKTMSQAEYNPVYQDGDSTTGEFDPWVSWGELRETEVRDYYMVARMDAADADAALALVDRAAEAHDLAAAGALDGVVYVDGRYGDTEPTSDDFGSYESGEWNMWGTRTVFEDLGWYDVEWDGNSEEFGTAPALEWCPDALYYAGWYSYNNYNDAFDWAPGAIGGHLDSCSACDIRSGSAWAANALSKGITATFGAVAEPYVAGMPEYDQFFAYLTSGASYGEAAYQSTVVGAWMMVWVGDPLYRPYPVD